MRILDRKAFEYLITTLWNSWNNRNNFFFRGKEEEARIVWERDDFMTTDGRSFMRSRRDQKTLRRCYYYRPPNQRDS
ncbi:hypothetical protein PVK06_013958 [Gossypium arboreum]|uniref:Uncharacterized protein n=1 Tax=Gossypium arboreum TaxID=29729 RepID=A0ABR0PTI5_GOSAR|nr:hypothetical protein PVK06_013958 [Gossypium arboreum]